MAVLDRVRRLLDRRTRARLALLGRRDFYEYLLRVALPAYVEQDHAGLLAAGRVLIHPTARITDPPRVSIGARSSIGAYANLRPSALGIHIGADVMIAQQVSILGDDHRFDDPRVPIRAQGTAPARVVIEDDVWIGANAVVLAGVTIGRGAVVGAGSVVTRDVAAWTVVAGAPARFVRARSRPDPGA